MNFELTDEQIMLQDLARKASQDLLAPIIAQDEENSVFRPEIIEKFGALGLTGISTSDHFSGAGLGYLENTIAVEEIAAVSASYAISVSVSGLPQLILSEFASQKQKEEFIPPLALGQGIGAFSLSESFSGSDAASLRTTAKKNAAGNYILNGTKLWCTQGNVARTIIVFARTAEASDTSAKNNSTSISGFIVPGKAAGVSTGKTERKMGLNASPTCEMIFDSVEIPRENLLGKEGDGFRIAMTALDAGRINIGAIAVGVARAALDYALKYALERKQFGKSISDFQGIQFLLADAHVQIEAARGLVRHAASLRDQGIPHSCEAATAKLFATEMAMKVTTDAVQILGGAGYTRDYPVERFMREAKVLQIVEGTNQIQRLVIARSLLSKQTQAS